MEALQTPPGHGPIALRVERVAALFDPFDPFPLPSRDLAKSAEEFIAGWARELPRAEPITIVLHMPADEVSSIEPDQIRTAVANHFSQRAMRVRGDLSEMFAIGRVSLGIGLAVLTASVLVSQLAAATLASGPLGSTISQGLLIFGWVANWRPIEIFLYDWWPLVQRRRLFLRISAARIDVQAD